MGANNNLVVYENSQLDKTKQIEILASSYTELKNLKEKIISELENEFQDAIRKYNEYKEKKKQIENDYELREAEIKEKLNAISLEIYDIAKENSNLLNQSIFKIDSTNDLKFSFDHSTITIKEENCPEILSKKKFLSKLDDEEIEKLVSFNTKQLNEILKVKKFPKEVLVFKKEVKIRHIKKGEKQS